MESTGALLRRLGVVLAVVLGAVAVPGAGAIAAPVGETAAIDAAVSTPVAVAPEVEAKAEAGEVRVIAVTDAPGDQVVDEVVADLPEGSAEGVEAGRGNHVALSVDAQGLDALAQAPSVVEVVEDKPNVVMEEAWLTTTGVSAAHTAGWDGTGRTVALLDTGVQADHPYLAGKVAEQACFSSSGTSLQSLCPGGASRDTTSADAAAPCTGVAGCYHGTHVAGIAAGGPVVSPDLVGVAPAAKVIAIKVFSKSTDPTICGSTTPCLVAYDSDIIAGLDWLHGLEVANDPLVATLDAVNLSLGGGLYSGACDAGNPVKASVDALKADGVAVVAAAGNNGVVGKMSSPACVSTVVSVGATDGAGSLAGYSNVSSQTDLLAPGSGIRSSLPGGDYGLRSGTSMATPMVTGALAVLRQSSPGSTVADLAGLLTSTGTPTSTPVGAIPELRLDAAVLREPGAPIGLAAAAGFRAVSVSWSPPSSPGGAPITSYTVSASPGGASCSVGGSGRGCTVTGLTNGTGYVFCVVATNSFGPGTAAVVAATPRALPAGSPIGSIDEITTGFGSVSVAGWAFDPETRNPIAVHVYVDGTGYPLTANRSRPDVDAVFGYGAKHGFSTTKPASPGAHRVCVYAIDVGVGSNTALGCRTVTVAGGSPVGSVDSVAAGVGKVSVKGWAIDPDTSAPIQVHVYVDGKGTALNADRRRSDVGKAFPAYGSRHGFGATIPVAGGAHTVCVYAIDVGAGSNTALGCRGVTVPGGSPFGTLDVARRNANGTIAVSGWAIDPDTSAPIQVHVYFVGPSYPLTGIPLVASNLRSDVGAAFRAYGPRHGYSMVTTSALPPGITLCAYGINVGAGSHTVLGCAFVP